MCYYTERHGMRKPIEQTYDIDSSKYSVLLGCCEKYYDNIAWKCPKECEDGRICFGLDIYRFTNEMRYEIPGLYINNAGRIDVPRIVSNSYKDGKLINGCNHFALLDFIEYMYENIHDVVKSNFQPFRLTLLNSRAVMLQFQDDINTCFLKTGLLYKLYTNGKVERVIPNDVVTPDIVKTVLGIKEEGTRNLLKEAIALHYSHAPNAARGSVERLWDAFERMKTYYTDLGKLHSVSKIVADMAGDSQTFYDIFDKEFRWLTNAGNNFRIRHHETDKVEIRDARHYDYFFNRCLSLIALAIQYLK